MAAIGGGDGAALGHGGVAPYENAATGRGGDVNTTGRTPRGARRKDFLPATRATAGRATLLTSHISFSVCALLVNCEGEEKVVKLLPAHRVGWPI